MDPTLPYAITVAAVNGEGLEAFVSTVTHASQDGSGSTFSFETPDGLGVDVSLQGISADNQLALAVTPVSAFPAAPTRFGNFAPAGVGFNIPTNQAVPSGQSATLTLRYPEGRLDPSHHLVLARYDPDRNQWIPLSTRAETAARQLIAATRAMGLFQVMVQSSLPSHVGAARVYPNPFRPALNNDLVLQEVPSGARVRIYTEGGRLVKEFTTGEGNSTWDGREADGDLVHSGVYVLRLEQNGETKRLRFVVER